MEAADELAGRVAAGHLEEVIARGDLEDDGHVAARLHGDLEHGQAHAEQIEAEVVEAEPVELPIALPGAELDDELDDLLLADGGGAEELAHVDDADAAELEVVAEQRRRAADDVAGGAPREDDLVVGDEAMSAVEYRRKRLGEAATSALFELKNLSIGKVAPDIVGEDLDGTPMKLSDYRGKVVVLDFWGDW